MQALQSSPSAIYLPMQVVRPNPSSPPNSQATPQPAKGRIPALEATKHVYVGAAARLNNRVGRSHQGTRVRERRMRRFKSADSAQQFLSTSGRICNHFQILRHLLPAHQHRDMQSEHVLKRGDG